MNWKKKASRIPGYDFAYFLAKGGQLFRVDYSRDKNRVRFFLEKAHGERHYSEIEHGAVMRSNIAWPKSGKPPSDPLCQESQVFTELPDPALSNTFQRFHQNCKQPQGAKPETPNKRVDADAQTGGESALTQDSLRQTRERYFQKQQVSKPRASLLRRFLPWVQHLLQILAIFILAALGHYGLHLSPLAMGALIALSGILLGGWEMFIQNRDPAVAKVLFLVVTGGWIYLNTYF